MTTQNAGEAMEEGELSVIAFRSEEHWRCSGGQPDNIL
jgi:hypothetical protein